MEFPKRSIKKYGFKKPDLTKMMELISKIGDQESFRKRYGRLLGILMTNVEGGILETLVQFYDPVYHCFTFPDYQLVPTLEEYSSLIGLPVLDKEPFNGFEPEPKDEIIAAAIHVKPAIVRANLDTKGGIRGLPSHFLYQKVVTFAQDKKTNAFESVFSLLIYGLVLFPNIDNFVDMNAIKIFLSKNPVPTLLADTYHSIHHRTTKGYGVIVCCAPLLYKWFISHLPASAVTRTDANWSQKIMPLTPADIIFYQASEDTGKIIDSCGEFPNVPLIGTLGGITYNPALAKRQFGYPMKSKPDSLYLAGEFYLNKEDVANMREKFSRAWHTIRRLDRTQLGRRVNFAHGSYTQWVIDRAMSFGLPYPLPRSLSASIPAPSLPIPSKTMGEYQEYVEELIRERDTWKAKYQEAERLMETMDGKRVQDGQTILELNQKIVQKNDMLQRLTDMLDSRGSKKARMDAFVYPPSDSDEPDA